MSEENKFLYQYSAPSEEERREIEGIRRRYQKSEHTDKLSRLRSLDRRARRLPLIVAICLGTAGTLIFGLGLSMILQWDINFLGALIAVAGAAAAACAHPVYRVLLRRGKEKHGEEILSLSSDLLGTDEKED